MSAKYLKIVCVVAAMVALAFAAMEIIYIGRVFEEKSLFSYMVKTGDTDSGSSAAIAHINGAAGYGRIVAIRVALGASAFGLLVGILATHWRLRRTHRHAA